MGHSPWIQRVLYIFKKYPESSRERDCALNIVLFDWNHSSEWHSLLCSPAHALGSCRVYIHLLMRLSLAYQVPTVCKGWNQATYLDNKAHKRLFLLFISKVKYFCNTFSVDFLEYHSGVLMTWFVFCKKRRKKESSIFSAYYMLDIVHTWLHWIFAWIHQHKYSYSLIITEKTEVWGLSHLPKAT